MGVFLPCNRFLPTSHRGMNNDCHSHGRIAPIVFSNGSRGRGSSGYRRLGMPAFSACSLALDGVSWDRAARLKTQSAGDAAGYKIHAVVCSLPRASLLAGARCGLLSQWSVGLRSDELRSVSQHGVHDDGEATRQSDARLAHG